MWKRYYGDGMHKSVSLNVPTLNSNQSVTNSQYSYFGTQYSNGAECALPKGQCLFDGRSGQIYFPSGSRLKLSHAQPDVIATISFYTTEAGGRKGPTRPDSLLCPMVLDELTLDVALWLEEVGSISPGDTVRVPMNFMRPALAMEHCAVGTKFFLREGRKIAEGVIDAVMWPHS